MIYETIPAKYFDHTALAKAIGETSSLIEMVKYYANEAADALMDADDSMSSGDAVQIGEFINWAKNIEFHVNHWIEVFNDFFLSLYPHVENIQNRESRSFDSILAESSARLCYEAVLLR